ncbi:MAG: long-chain fatty acid--CoA ligase [Gloeobacterales cyanobacterium]
MNLAHLLDQTATDHPERVAFMNAEQQLSYQEFQKQSMALAGGLKQLGVGKGDRVAIMLPNILPFPTLTYAIWRLGAQLVTLNPLMKSQEVAYILSDSEAIVLVTLGALADGLELPEYQGAWVVLGETSQQAVPYPQLFQANPAIQPEPLGADEVVAVIYTSGTTGRPKGAMLTSRNLDFDSAAAGEAIKLSVDDRLYCVLPLFHVYALNVALLVCVRSGASVFLEPRFVPQVTLKHLKEYHCTVFIGVPALFGALLAASKEGDLQKLRCCISGSAPLPISVLKQFEEKFQTVILEGDGPTECSPVTSFNPIDGTRKIGSIGIPLAEIEMAIVNPETDEFIPVGDVGEIVVKGPNVFKGYWNQPEETAKVLKNGWYHTGDLGYVDEDGYFYIVDRIKDLIIVGGLNVYAREVEEILYQHPAIIACAVVGEYDTLRGEVVHAFVEIKEHKTSIEKDIIKFTQEQLADYKCPRKVTVLEQLPRSLTGKILKRTLKEGLKGYPLKD